MQKAPSLTMTIIQIKEVENDKVTSWLKWKWQGDKEDHHKEEKKEDRHRRMKWQGLDKDEALIAVLTVVMTQYQIL